MSDLRTQKWQRDLTTIGNVTFTSGLLAIATAKDDVQTDATINYSINGVMYTKGATDGFALSGGVQAASTKRLYVFTINAAGTIACVAGDAVAATSTPVYPEVDDDVAVFGALQVETSSSVTFTPGTTELDAAGITDTYINLSRIPA